MEPPQNPGRFNIKAHVNVVKLFHDLPPELWHWVDKGFAPHQLNPRLSGGQVIHHVYNTALVGIRLAFAASWAAIVAAELIGSPSGLGFAIEWYRQMLMTPKVFAFILAIGVVGYVCDLGLRKLQRRLTPWAEGTGASS